MVAKYRSVKWRYKIDKWRVFGNKWLNFGNRLKKSQIKPCKNTDNPIFAEI